MGIHVFQVPKSLKKKLDNYARTHRVTLCDVVRYALDEIFKREGKFPEVNGVKSSFFVQISCTIDDEKWKKAKTIVKSRKQKFYPVLRGLLKEIIENEIDIKGTKQVVKTIKLSLDDYERLVKYARENKLSVSEVLRTIVDKILEHNGPLPVKKANFEKGYKVVPFKIKQEKWGLLLLRCSAQNKTVSEVMRAFI